MDDPGLTLEDVDRLIEESWDEPRRIDPLCPCAACSSWRLLHRQQ